jgi:hypothetical protein
VVASPALAAAGVLNAAAAAGVCYRRDGGGRRRPLRQSGLEQAQDQTRGRRGLEMLKSTIRLVTATFVLTLSNAACASTGPDQGAVWGSNEVSLTIAESTTTLQILASGGCYGSYGEIAQPIPSGTFSLTGTYSQLTGVFPGSVQYPARYDGAVAGRHMTLTISVPALQQTLGPFSLTHGVAQTWPACLYP